MLNINPLFSTAFEFSEPRCIHAAWGVVLIALIGLIATRMKIRASRRFADETRLPPMLGLRRQWIAPTRALLVVAGMVLIVGSLMGPRSNPHQETTETKGRDIVFLVDVSKSMLVRDVAPNRLERAKLWIKDTVADLKTDRVRLEIGRAHV